MSVMRFPCIESTCEIPYGDATIRLWLGQENLKFNFSEEKTLVKMLKIHLQNDKLTLSKLVDKILELAPNLNAIQVIKKADEEGIRLGSMVYTVPF